MGAQAVAIISAIAKEVDLTKQMRWRSERIVADGLSRMR